MKYSRPSPLRSTRHTTRSTGRPAAALCSARVTWLTLLTAWRFTSRMTSFGCTPARAAAPARDLELARRLGRDRLELHAEVGRRLVVGRRVVRPPWRTSAVRFCL